MKWGNCFTCPTGSKDVHKFEAEFLKRDYIRIPIKWRKIAIQFDMYASNTTTLILCTTRYLFSTVLLSLASSTITSTKNLPVRPIMHFRIGWPERDTPDLCLKSRKDDTFVGRNWRRF